MKVNFLERNRTAALSSLLLAFTPEVVYLHGSVNENIGGSGGALRV